MFSDFIFGRKNDCVTGHCAECTNNQHCSSEKYCKGYKCVSPNTKECTFDHECVGFYSKCDFGNCQLDFRKTNLMFWFLRKSKSED